MRSSTSFRRERRFFCSGDKGAGRALRGVGSWSQADFAGLFSMLRLIFFILGICAFKDL